MPNLTINFGGQTLVFPGAYVYTTLSGLTQPAPTVPPLMYIGYGYGVKPKTPTTFYTGQDLINALRGGPASAYVTPMTLPSPSVNGTTYITFIDASENTVASGSLLSGAGGSAVISMTSTIYGPPANLIQVGVFSPSVSGVEIEVLDGYTNQLYTGNNLGYPFMLAYDGTATGSLSYAVNGAAGNATGFVLSSPIAGESFSVTLSASTYPTVADLVQYINGTGYWSATLLSSTQGQLSSSLLDIASGVLTGVPASGVPTYYGVASKYYDVITWFNTFTPVVSAALASTGTKTGTILGQSLTPLTGAAGIAPTLGDYATCFNLALNYPAWVVFADNNSVGVQALGAQHAETASETQNRTWRRFMTGSSVGDSVTTTVNNAQALNSRTTTYSYPGITVVNTTTGLDTTYGGLYVAAAAAGMACGNFVAMPLTNKALNGVTVEQTLTNSQMAQLQNSGVMCTFLSNNIPTILSDVTTWQQDSNPENVFNQQVACIFWVSYSLVAAMTPYIGGVAAPSVATSIGNAVVKTLNSLIFADTGLSLGGQTANTVLAGWQAGSIVVSYNGTTQQWSVSCQVQLVGQNRFITMTVYAAPFSQGATVVG